MIRISKFTMFLIVATIVINGCLVAVVGFQESEYALDGFGDVFNGEYLSVVYALVPVLAWLVWGPSTIRSWGGTRSYVGRAVLSLGAGLALWAAGALVWFYYDTCYFWPGPLDCGTAAQDPYPSLADAFYLAFLPFALIVVHNLARVLNLGVRQLVQAASVFVLAVLVSGYWAFPSMSLLGFDYGRDYLVFDGATTAELAVGYGYIFSEGLLMSAAVVLALNSVRIAGGYLRRPMMVIGACFAFLYVGDFLLVWRDGAGTYQANGDMSEIFYAGFCLTGAWALREFHELANRVRTGG